jgi:hypothetical protein
MPSGRALDPNHRDYADRAFGIDFSPKTPTVILTLQLFANMSSLMQCIVVRQPGRHHAT